MTALPELGREQMHLLIEHLPAAVAMFDLEMRYVAVSRRWREVYGLGEEPLLGRSHYAVIPEIPDRWRDVHRRVLAGAVESAVDDPFERANGNMDWVSWEARPWFEASGEIGGLVLFTEVVTARKRAEELDERYRMLARSSRDLILFVRRADGRIVEANEAAQQAYGYTREELLECTILDLRVPEDTDLVRRQMLEADAKGLLFETTHRRKDGSRFPVEVSSRGATIGGVRVLLSIVRDVTRRKQAMEALVASEHRYQELVRLSPDAVLIIRDGLVDFVNRAATNLFGAREESELAGREMLTLIHPDYHEIVRARTRRAMQGQIATLLEEKVIRLDGRVVDVEATGSAFEDARGRALQVVFRDITERKRHEAAEREAERDEVSRHGEARFQALIEHSADLLLVVGPNGTLSFWSPGSEAVLGWSESETVGRPSDDFVHPDDQMDASKSFRELVACPGATVDSTLRLRHRDGSWRLVESVARNLLADPDVRGIVINGRDVTEQRELQRRFLEAQKLESIGRLAGGVAHDFNNLLTAILGGVEALDDALNRGVPVQREDVDAIHEAGDRARDLTRQLLSFARRQVIAPTPLDLNALVRDTEKLLRRLLPENVAIVTDLTDGLAPVLGDLAQLQQVIVNLSVNARDAMPCGGALTLTTRPIAFDAAAAAAAGLPGPCAGIRLVVADNGTGMNDDVRAHLFEPFFTTKPQGQGTGLGLAAVYGIVTQNHGRIEVESRSGEGTVIAIDLPCTDQRGSRHEEVTGTASGGSETVLLVEDETLVRDITARSLRKAGYRVLVAAHANEALVATAADSERIDLLVTDVVMPGLNGPELAERLLGRHPDMQVLFVSGYTQDAIGRDGVLRPGVEFLQKPFRMSALLARVRGILDGAGQRGH